MAVGDITVTYTCTATTVIPRETYPVGSTTQQIVDQETDATYARNALANILNQDDQIPGTSATVTAVVSEA